MEPEVKVYISCPIKVPFVMVKEVAALVEQAGGVPSFWDRGLDYVNTALLEADFVVFVPPDNEWNLPITRMTSGSYKELQLACQHQKLLFKSYVPVNGDGLGIYRASTNGITFSSLSGSRHTLEHLISEKKGEIQDKMTKYASIYEPVKQRIITDVVEKLNKKLLLIK